MGLFKLQEEFKINESFFGNDSNDSLSTQDFTQAQNEVKSWLKKNPLSKETKDKKFTLETKFPPYNKDGQVAVLSFKGKSITATFSLQWLLAMLTNSFLAYVVSAPTDYASTKLIMKIHQEMNKRSKKFDYKISESILKGLYSPEIELNIKAKLRNK